MITASQLEENPSLYVFLPLLNVAWNDAVLTDQEIHDIQNLVDSQEWMNETAKNLVKGYLDPNKPPSPLEMKMWQKEIKKVSDKVPKDLRTNLVDIGINLASINGMMVLEPDALKKAQDSLGKIEHALGVLSKESEQVLFGEDVATKDVQDLPSFDIQQMAKLLDGDQHETIAKVKQILTGKGFDYFEGDLNGYREQVLVWCKTLADQGFGALGYPKEFGGGGDMAAYFATMEALSYHDLSMVIKYGVQFGLFGMSVYFLGTEKHHRKYLDEIGKLSLPGSFAMTETGHGSNVRDIETTATFDHVHGHFIVNTPHDMARKDYIGNAACHAQMATVFAKLIIDGVDYGVNAFLVPLRDQSGKTLKGVRIEDCGKKIGLNGVDNGRIWFDNVVIPKDNMLDKYASVNESGQFESPIASDSRRFFTMLGTLVGGRIGVPRSGLSAAKSGLAIAIKYGDRRKQFGPENGREVKILDYRTHQRRLIPLLANAYAVHFSLQYLTDRFLQRTDDDMREIEALAAGLKSFATWNTTATLQACREACGGKGYLAENRLGQLKNDTEIYTTFEGDNTVLMQLVAKSRLTEFKQEFHDISVFGILNYVTDQAKTAIMEMNPVTIRNTDNEHLMDPEFQLGAFKYRERDILTSAARRLKKHLDGGMGSFEAFNQCQYHLLNVGKAFTERVILEQFITRVKDTANPELRVILKKLCDVFALTQIEKNKGWYLEHDYMAGTKTKAIRRLVNHLCKDVRKDAVALVDAFGIPDSCLAAPIALGKEM